MSIFKHELGAHVKDIVTGFKGAIIARSEFLNGCIRYIVAPTKLDKDGSPIKEEHFDEAQLVPHTGKKIVVQRQPIHDRPGGPREPVRRRSEITR